MMSAVQQGFEVKIATQTLKLEFRTEFFLGCRPPSDETPAFRYGH